MDFKSFTLSSWNQITYRASKPDLIVFLLTNEGQISNVEFLQKQMVKEENYTDTVLLKLYERKENEYEDYSYEETELNNDDNAVFLEELEKYCDEEKIKGNI